LMILSHEHELANTKNIIAIRSNRQPSHWQSEHEVAIVSIWYEDEVATTPQFPTIIWALWRWRLPQLLVICSSDHELSNTSNWFHKLLIIIWAESATTSIIQQMLMI
jgi:hypothetical protein